MNVARSQRDCSSGFSLVRLAWTCAPAAPFFLSLSAFGFRRPGEAFPWAAGHAKTENRSSARRTLTARRYCEDAGASVASHQKPQASRAAPE